MGPSREAPTGDARAVCRHPSCAPWQRECLRSESKSPARSRTTVRVAHATLPQGSSLRSELCCLGPSSLNRPHPPHSRAHRDFALSAYTQCLRCAITRHGLGSPRAVPSFRCHSLSACLRLRPREVRRLHVPSSFATGTGLRQLYTDSALPSPPTPALPVGHLLRGFTTVRSRYDLSTCSPPWRS